MEKVFNMFMEDAVFSTLYIKTNSVNNVSQISFKEIEESARKLLLGMQNIGYKTTSNFCRDETIKFINQYGDTFKRCENGLMLTKEFSREDLAEYASKVIGSWPYDYLVLVLQSCDKKQPISYDEECTKA